ncbi:MAG: TetR/AcrR family transcriptional regulator [Christensenellaceae bacterium]|nr:TetR/AcrR family transcriptional regulator [Christensenellaceae bacterium]
MGKKLQEKFDDNRLSILQAATTLFAKKGVMGASFSDIAKEVKLSKGTVSYYFPSKEHLVYEVNEFNLGAITAMVFKWIESLQPGQNPKEAVKTLLGQLSESAECMSLELCMMFECMQDTFGLKKRVVEKLYEWKTMLKIGLMKIGLSGGRLDAYTVICCALMESLIVRSSLGVETHSVDVLFDELDKE